MASDDTNTSPAELKAEFERIAHETGVECLLNRKEFKELSSVLEADERILAFTTGIMEKSNWLITLTDRRILFLQKKLFGVKRAVIGLDSVTTLLGHKGLFFDLKRSPSATDRQAKSSRKSGKTPAPNLPGGSVWPSPKERGSNARRNRSKPR